ncbi:hypothetical protein L0Y65_03410 [Candidatus Micrarchaeota archaeon]|nr:hypothetical protein [Candidatus Micrarchaeota archaeon]
MLSKTTLLALALIVSCSFALNLVTPAVHDVKPGDTIDLGTIGPGQTVSLLIDPKVASGGIHGQGGLYDQAVMGDLPRGWTSQDSKLYQNPLMLTISADPDAPEGDYVARVTVIDENNGEELGNVTFNVKVRITWDVMDFDVSPNYRSVGPGQPARFAITITNKGSTSDVFQVSATGAKRWEFTKPVFVPAQSTKTFYYEIVATEEETYRTTVGAVSLASGNIAESENVTLFVRSDLIGDYKAANNGAVVFPIFEAPIYALAGLLSNLFN